MADETLVLERSTDGALEWLYSNVTRHVPLALILAEEPHAAAAKSEGDVIISCIDLRTTRRIGRDDAQHASQRARECGPAACCSVRSS